LKDLEKRIREEGGDSPKKVVAEPEIVYIYKDVPVPCTHPEKETSH
jgi:hypothetical protein